MKVIACYKVVPYEQSISVAADGSLNFDKAELIVGQYDLNAIEAGAQLVEKNGGELTALTVGTAEVENSKLRKSVLSRGPANCVTVNDPALANADCAATSAALAEAVKKIGEYDLIFAGRQAIDGDTAQVGPQIAEKLGIPQVSYVKEFEIDGKEVTVKRALEDGYEVIKLQTPCLLTAIKELNTPRYMYIKGIYKAMKHDIKVWNAADIGVDLTTVGLKASPTNVFKSFTPKPKGAGQKVAGDTDKELAINLLIGLKEKNII